VKNVKISPNHERAAYAARQVAYNHPKRATACPIRVACMVIMAACFFSAPHVARGQIRMFRPQFGVPVFVEPGNMFTAEIYAAAGLATQPWSAVLANDLRTWTCSVTSVAYGMLVYNNSTTGYQLGIQVPTNAPPEVFRLIVSHPSAGGATNRHAVSVVPCLETNFYIVHYADPQASASNAVEASGKNTPYGSIEELYWHAPVFSLINPRFLFDTGDELDDGDVDTANRYAQYLNAMDTFGPPLLITRGNNDRGDFNHWKTNIGQACYTIGMGSFSIWMNDTRDSEMYAWFTNAYAASFADTNIRYRLFGQHFHNNSDGRNPYFVAPSADQYPHLMLVGHNHTFSTLQTAPYPILSSGPAHYYGAFGLFAFYRDGTNWTCPAATNHPNATRAFAVTNWGAPLVSLDFSQPNNGTAATNEAVITNRLAFSFWDGRVRFLMRSATAGYTVSGGEELAEYEYGNTQRAVVVRVSIPASTQTVVSVAPTPDNDGDGVADAEDDDDDNDGMPDDWEAAYGLDSRDPSDAAEDADADTLSNLAEFIAGTDPSDARSVFCIAAVSNLPPICLYVPAVSSRWYAAYWRSSLIGSEEWHILTSNVPGSAEGLVIEDTTDATQRFYRVSVQR
jgi:hypothetical protein